LKFAAHSQRPSFSRLRSLGFGSLTSHSLLQVADTEKKLSKEIEILKAKEKRAVDAADAATAQVLPRIVISRPKP
jgi:hypothetical protein